MAKTKSKIKGWMNKGYGCDGTCSLSKVKAQARASYLRDRGYKARAVKGQNDLYVVMRKSK